MSNFLNNSNKNWSVVADRIQNREATGIVKIGPSYFQVPVGPSGDRPTTGLDNGFIRFNTSDNFLEYYSVTSHAWVGISVPTLDDVLTAGDDAGGLNITNLNDIALTTINGAAYPPVVADNTLTEVLTAGNAAGGLSITGLNDVALTTINGTAYPPPATDPTITETNTDATYYPVFVDGAGSGITLRADTTTNPISVNPNTGDFNVVDTLKINQTAVAVGKSAGLTTQGASAVAIGIDAGNNTQGTNAVAIGRAAGQDNQHDNTIVLNATGLTLNTTGTGGFFVKPIRKLEAMETEFVNLRYNHTTGELGYR